MRYFVDEIIPKRIALTSNFDFFGLIISLYDDDNVRWECQTEWVGFADQGSRVELRQPRVDTLRAQFVWFYAAGLPDFWVVETEVELIRAMQHGGGLAIEASIARANFPDFLAPMPVYSPEQGDWKTVIAPIDEVTRRAPTAKLRMRILKRDNYWYRICGQSPKSDTNIVLNVHHVKPWSQRGLSADGNLIALCHTCHRGLDPHYDKDLIRHLNGQIRAANSTVEGILRYRGVL